MDDLKDKRVTVAGLGHFGGGIAVARWLVEQGAKVLVTDKEPADKLADSLEKLAGLPIDYHLGGHSECDFTDAQLVVTSPAVPPSSPYIQAALRAGVPVSTEMRLFLERCPSSRVVGVTGTKGKSTTTALLDLMLRTRHTTWTGGNIGKSLLAELPNIKSDAVVLLELSSYMLEYLRPMSFSPHVALVTFLSMDHTAWHGSHEAYLEAKIDLVRHQTGDDHAILPEGQTADRFAAATRAQVTRYRLGSCRAFDLPRLAGDHNQLNAQAAYLAASKLGVTWDDAQSAVRDFGGLPHRLQLVHEAGGVRYYNDSIATIPEAAVVACTAFEPGKVIQIVGGSDKDLDMRPMCRALRDRCKAILAIGQIRGPLAEHSRGGMARVEVFEHLADAMKLARQLAEPGDVVLLSTGTASYGYFTNFEHRGEEFARLAKQA